MELSYILATEVEALFLSGFSPQQIFAELAARYPREDFETLQRLVNNDMYHLSEWYGLDGIDLVPYAEEEGEFCEQ